MKCSVFIATSADGFIAREDGNVEWLHSSGKPEADMGDNADMGFNQFIASVDCMIMGRKCMEVIASMNLTDEQWPYGDIRIIVLSNTLKEAPVGIKERVEMYSGDIRQLVNKLEHDGFKHAYIDGGKTIQTFINLKLINELTLTQVPILIGKGIPLFSELANDVSLENAQAQAFPNNYIQLKYHVKYG
jgi:dihydrofolate reductase